MRSICERVLQDVMYDLPESKFPTTVTVCESDVTGETKPEIVPAAGCPVAHADIEPAPAAEAVGEQSA